MSTEAHRLATAQLVAARCILVLFAAGSFVDVVLFSFGSFNFSLQKALTFLGMPVAVLMIGQAIAAPQIAVFGALLGGAYGASYLASADAANVLFWKGLLTLAEGSIAAVAVYTALVVQRDGVRTFAQIWIWLSVMSAAVAVAQAAGLLPLFVVPPEFKSWRETEMAGVFRGTAFKYDPNFLAMMIGLGLAWEMAKARPRALNVLILMSGIVATFSRMGILLVLALVLVSGVAHFVRRKNVRLTSCRVVGLAVILAGTASWLAVGPLRSYVETRVQDLVDAGATMQSIRVAAPEEQFDKLTSALERLLLIRGAWEIILKSPWAGIGAYREREVMLETVGIEKSSHNIFVELPMIGGLFGWGVLLSLFLLGRGRIRHYQRLHQREGGLSELRALVLVAIWVGISGTFLSFVYYQIIWLPLVLRLAVGRRLAQSAREQTEARESGLDANGGLGEALRPRGVA